MGHRRPARGNEGYTFRNGKAAMPEAFPTPPLLYSLVLPYRASTARMKASTAASSVAQEVHTRMAA